MCAESCETHVLDPRPNLVATLQHLVKFSELAGGWEPQYTVQELRTET